MSIKSELNNLNERDVWSLLLFALFNVKDIPEYSGLSELAYVLDRKSLLKLCEYFGGCTITIPTLEELETLTYALLLFEYVDLQGMELEDAILKIDIDATKRNNMRNLYVSIRRVLKDYEFTSRDRI